VELGDDGTWHAIQDLPGHGAVEPDLACGPPPANRCVLLWREATWELQPLGDGPARLIPIRDRNDVTMAVSPDGNRVALGVLQDQLTVVDLGRGTERTWPGVAGCFHQQAAWSRTDDAIYTSVVCNRDYGVARLRPGHPPELLSRDHRWTGSFVVGPADELYVSQRSFEKDYVLVDGL
jgi:hypothetical protein